MTRAYPIHVITGSSRGIGRSLARLLARDASVLGVARSSTEYGETNYPIYDLHVDLSKPESAIAQIGEWFSDNPSFYPITYTSCAATTSIGVCSDRTTHEILETFSLNTVTPLRLSGYLAKISSSSRRTFKSLFVTSSLARNIPELSFSGLCLYSMSKAALNRGALILQREMDESGLSTVSTTAHPGIVDSDMQRELRSSSEIDWRFKEKNERLPDYQPGDWDDCSPHEKPRTITPNQSAEFLYWILNHTDLSEIEYDYYSCAAFHSEDEVTID